MTSARTPSVNDVLLREVAEMRWDWYGWGGVGGRLMLLTMAPVAAGVVIGFVCLVRSVRRGRETAGHERDPRTAAPRGRMDGRARSITGRRRT